MKIAYLLRDFIPATKDSQCIFHQNCMTNEALIAMEMMMYELPVMGTNTGGLTEIREERMSGLNNIHYIYSREAKY